MSEPVKQKVDFSLAIKTIDLIRKKEGDKTQVSGELICPSCGGIFKYNIAFNGHIHGKCTGTCGLIFMM